MKKNNQEKQITVEGMMSYGMQENGLHTADFTNFEGAENIEPFEGKCDVKLMSDGNLYLTELPKPKAHKSQGKKLFCEDNSTLSLGVDRKLYYLFVMPEAEISDMPDKLIHQAVSIAEKINDMLRKQEVIKYLS